MTPEQREQGFCLDCGHSPHDPLRRCGQIVGGVFEPEYCECANLGAMEREIDRLRVALVFAARLLGDLYSAGLLSDREGDAVMQIEQMAVGTAVTPKRERRAALRELSNEADELGDYTS